MVPIGYVVAQHATRDARPVKSYLKWMNRIPGVYRDSVLDRPGNAVPRIEDDEHRLAEIKHYRSLMPMAMEARKPMFLLRPADGAIGAHVQAVQSCRENFSNLAVKLLSLTE